MKYKIIYGEDCITIKKRNKEIVHWIKYEWIENPNVVFSICNAIELAYKGELEKVLNKEKTVYLIADRRIRVI